MLAVITDDFTGASEIAGIALSKGYSTVIETRTVRRQDDADVLVIATDMRSLDASSAARKSARLTEEVLALKPELIFKKVDSVLRGNIGPELEAQMRVEEKSAALLIPANPSRKRTIADGIYFVDNKPVAESGFALNHDFASETSKVVDILNGRGASNTICISTDQPFAASGVHIGNTEDSEDLRTWASKITDHLVPAGAADFFAALLDFKHAVPTLNGTSLLTECSGRRLYVCGSNFPSSRQAVDDARRQGAAVLSMPDDVYFNDHLDRALLDRWARDVIETFSESSSAIVTALQNPSERSISGPQVTAAMAEIVRQVVGQVAIDDLMIEGGATSQAVISALNIDCLYPSQSLAPGVTRMRVDSFPNMHVTMKPGSYQWPAEIWDFSN